MVLSPVINVVTIIIIISAFTNLYQEELEGISDIVNDASNEP